MLRLGLVEWRAFLQIFGVNHEIFQICCVGLWTKPTSEYHGFFISRGTLQANSTQLYVHMLQHSTQVVSNGRGSSDKRSNHEKVAIL